MKKILSSVFMLTILVSGCSQDDVLKNNLTTSNSLKFIASFESNESRTYVEEGNLLRWTAGDQISLFEGSTLNSKYQFDGETGDNGGSFTKVGNSFSTGNPLNKHIAVYPYASNTKISEDGVVTATLPAEQNYAENSFGLGDNTMVAVTQNTNDMFLKFKNVGGYLMFQLYGDDVTVKSITLKGNSNEKIAGKAIITPNYSESPTVSMTDEATETIVLNCGEGVKIGTTAETATAFWIVLPPTTFVDGFSITVTDIDGGEYTKTTSNQVSVKRNVIKPMAAFEVKPKIAVVKSVTLYSSGTLAQYITEEEKNTITSLKITGPLNDNDIEFINQMIKNKMGAWDTYEGEGEGSLMTLDLKESTIVTSAISLISNTLVSLVLPNGLDVIALHCEELISVNIPEGVISLDLSGCSALKSVILPDGLLVVDLQSCESLKSVDLPNGVERVIMHKCKSLTTIDVPDGIELVYSNVLTSNNRFEKLIDLSECTSLITVNLPNSVKEIGESAFYNCVSLKNVSLPNELEIIGSGAFVGCSSLTDMEFPNSITEIHDSAFAETSLISIVLPENLTYLRFGAFAGCKNLSSVTFNCTALECIEYCVFGACNSLTTIVLPDGVRSLGELAFHHCTSLKSVIIPSSVTSLGKSVFNGDSALEEIHCKATTPPTATENTFLEVPSDCIIYVPENCSEAYRQADFWKFFSDIREE